MQRSYLDYAMSVIVGRALPDVRDGLKPVHRKILYAMYDSRLPPRPRLREVRPRRRRRHGSVTTRTATRAIYDALVRMAQPWSLRYPLIDGNGNFGSPGNDPAAAMRYTECQLDPLAMEMLRDIDEDTVDFAGQLRRPGQGAHDPAVADPQPAGQRLRGHRGRHGHQDPAAQPARDRRRPCSGAWSTRRPTRPSTLDELIEIVKGPDFPTYGLIVGTHARSRTRTAPAAARSGCARWSRSRRTSKGRAVPGRHRAAVPGQPGQPRRADRRAGQGGQARRHRRHPRRVLRPYRHAPRDRAQARRGRQGRAEQPLQAHPAAGDVRRQHAGAGRRRAAHAQPGPVHPLLRRRTRSRSSSGARAYRLRKAEERAHILRGLVKALDALDEVIALIRRSPTVEEARARPDPAARHRRDPGHRDPRHAAAPPGRAGAPEDHRRAGQDRDRDRRPQGHPGQARAAAEDHLRRARPRSSPSGATTAAPRSSRSTARSRWRTSSRARTWSSRSPAPATPSAPRSTSTARSSAAARACQRGDTAPGRHRQPLLRLLDARLDPVLHEQGPGLPGQGVRAARGEPGRQGPARGQPAGVPARRAHRPGHRDPELPGRAVPGARHQERPGEEDQAGGVRLQPQRRDHRASTCATRTSWSAPRCSARRTTCCWSASRRRRSGSTPPTRRCGRWAGPPPA